MKKVLMFSIIDDLLKPNLINGEREYMFRLRKALKNIGQAYIITDRHGNVYDYDNHKFSGQVYSDFNVIAHFSTMYTELPLLDTYHIMALWNPINHLNHIEVNAIAESYSPNASIKKYLPYESYSDFISPSLIQSQNYNALIGLERVKFLNYHLYLPSVSKSDIMSVAETFNKIFYVGVAWEEFIQGKDARHSYELSKLSEKGLLDIYGPKYSWQHKNDMNYKGEIPIDGKSIFDKIHNSGITLALAGEDHARSEIATNRIFEGIAAGSIVISNIRGQVYDMFGDNILYLDNNQSPQQRSEQIIEYYNWIQENTATARNMVNQAQEILTEQYCLEVLLNNIIADLPKRQKHLHNNREISISEEKPITVIYPASEDLNQIKTDILHILAQNYQQLHLHIFNASHSEYLKQFIFENNYKHRQITIVDQYYDSHNQTNIFEYLYQRQDINQVAIFTAGTIWKHNFLSVLARLLNDNPDRKIALAKSGLYNKQSDDGQAYRDFYEYNDLRFDDYNELYADVRNKHLDISSVLFDINCFKTVITPSVWGFLGQLSGLYVVMSGLQRKNIITSQYILVNLNKNYNDDCLATLNQENILLLEYIFPARLRSIQTGGGGVLSGMQGNVKKYSMQKFLNYKKQWRNKSIVGKILSYPTLRFLRNKYKYYRDL